MTDGQERDAVKFCSGVVVIVGLQFAVGCCMTALRLERQLRREGWVCYGGKFIV